MTRMLRRAAQAVADEIAYRWEREAIAFFRVQHERLALIEAQTREILERLRGEDAATVEITAGPPTEHPTDPTTPHPRRIQMAQLRMTETQQSVLSISIRNRRANEAPVQNPTLVSSDPGVAAVEFDPATPHTGTVKGVASGTCLITFDCDADLTDGERHIIGTLDVVVDAGEAVVVEIGAGAPTEQP